MKAPSVLHAFNNYLPYTYNQDIVGDTTFIGYYLYSSKTERNSLVLPSVTLSLSDLKGFSFHNVHNGRNQVLNWKWFGF